MTPLQRDAYAVAFQNARSILEHEQDSLHRRRHSRSPLQSLGRPRRGGPSVNARLVSVAGGATMETVARVS